MQDDYWLTDWLKESDFTNSVLLPQVLASNAILEVEGFHPENVDIQKGFIVATLSEDRNSFRISKVTSAQKQHKLKIQFFSSIHNNSFINL